MTSPNLRAWKTSAAWALGATLTLRVALGAVMAATWLLVKPYVSAGQLAAVHLYGSVEPPTNFPADALLGVWLRWDAIHYLNLVQRGYLGVSPGDSVFYPLYVVLTRAMTLVTGGDIILASLLVSTLACFFTFAGLYRLAEDFYGPEAARWSVVALAAFPTALFLIAPFTESLFLALTLGTFLAAYRGRWYWAGLLGLLASLARGAGMLTALPLAILAYQQWRKDKQPLWSRWGLAVVVGVVLPVVGNLAFLAWRASVGFPSLTDTYTQFSGVALMDPFSNFAAALVQWFTVHDLPTTLDVLSVVLALILIICMVIRPQWRKLDWLAFVILNLGLFLVKHNLHASYIQSLSRYILTLFPGFIVLGDWLARQGRLPRFIYVIGSGATLIVFACLYTLWVFVG